MSLTGGGAADADPAAVLAEQAGGVLDVIDAALVVVGKWAALPEHLAPGTPGMGELNSAVVQLWRALVDARVLGS